MKRLNEFSSEYFNSLYVFYVPCEYEFCSIIHQNELRSAPLPVSMFFISVERHHQIVCFS